LVPTLELVSCVELTQQLPQILDEPFVLFHYGPAWPTSGSRRPKICTNDGRNSSRYSRVDVPLVLNLLHPLSEEADGPVNIVSELRSLLSPRPVRRGLLLSRFGGLPAGLVFDNDTAIVGGRRGGGGAAG
jgi:hypothetical protein